MEEEPEIIKNLKEKFPRIKDVLDRETAGQIGLLITALGLTVVDYIAAVALGLPHSELTAITIGFATGYITRKLLSED